MGSITFIEHDGTPHAVDIEAGKSLMQTAMDNGIPGVDADCGGDCACGTCHVMVGDQWVDMTGSASEDEKQMLALTPERVNNSRLACQISTSDEMDGMVITLPEFQM